MKQTFCIPIIICLSLFFNVLFAQSNTESCFTFDLNILQTSPSLVFGAKNTKPGQAIYEKNGLHVSLDSFLYTDKTKGYMNVTIGPSPIDIPIPGINGNAAFISNIQTVFKFTDKVATEVCFAFWDGGGEENIRVNDASVSVVGGLGELHGKEVAPGVKAEVRFLPDSLTNGVRTGVFCLKGKIKKLAIGGQELLVDNICYELDDDSDDFCRLTSVQVTRSTQTDSGGYQLLIKPILKPSLLTVVDSFVVAIEGRKYGVFAEHDFPISILNYIPMNDDLKLEVTICEAFRRDCCKEKILDLSSDDNLEDCIGFEQLRAAKYVGTSLDSLPFYNENFVDFYLKPFLADTGTILVIDADNLDAWDSANDNAVYLEDAKLKADFSAIPDSVTEVSIDFYYKGGPLKFWINDEGLVSLEELRSGDFPLTGTDIVMQIRQGRDTPVGQIVIKGKSIKNLCIGAAGTAFDNLCYKVAKPACQIQTLRGEVSSCDSLGQYYVNLRIEPINALDSVLIKINDLHKQVYDVTPNGAVRVGPLTARLGKTLVLHAFDPNNVSCNKVLPLNAPTCVSADSCKIGELKTETVCTGDGTYFVVLNFEHNQPLTESFKVDGQAKSFSFKYAQLPVKVGPFKNDQPLRLLVRGGQNTDACSKIKLYEPGICPEACKLGEIKVRDIVCDPITGKYNAIVSFDYKNADSVFVLKTGGGFVRQFKTSELPLKLTGIMPAPTATGLFDYLQICSATQPDCCQETKYELPCRKQECYIGKLSADVICNDTSRTYTLAFKFPIATVSIPNDSIVVYVDGVAQDTLPLSANASYRIPNLPIGFSPLHKLTVCSVKLPNCCQTLSYQLNCAPKPCKIEDLKVTNIECDPVTGKYAFTVNFKTNDTTGTFALKTSSGIGKTFTAGDLPLRLTGQLTSPLTGNRIELVVCSQNSEDCCEDTKFELSCGRPCAIGPLKIKTECTSDSTYAMEFTYLVPPNVFVSDSLIVSINGRVVDTIKTAGGVAFLRNLPIERSTAYKLTVCDLKNPNCCQSAEYKVDCAPKPCKISSIKYERFCEDSGKHYWYVKFDHNRHPDSTFIVAIDGERLGRFKYSNLPVKIGPFEPREDARALLVVDGTNNDCREEVKLPGKPCPVLNECFIKNVKTEAICTDSSRYYWVINFTHNQPKDSSFVVSFGDSRVGAFKYGELPIKIGPFEPVDAKRALTISNRSQAVSCSVTIGVNGNPCPLPPACSIGELAISNLECSNQSGTYSFTINFRHANAGSTFVLTTGRGYTKRFKPADLPLRLTNVPRPTTNVEVITVKSGDLADCFAQTKVEIPCVTNTCQLGAIRAVLSDCDSTNSYSAKLSMEYAGVSDSFELYVNNRLYGTFKYSQLPLQVNNLPGNTGQTTTFTIKDKLKECKQALTIEPVRCNTPPTCSMAIKAEALPCVDGRYSVKVAVANTTPSENGFILFVNGRIAGPFRYGNTSPIIVGPFNSNNSGQRIQILAIDLANPAQCNTNISLDPVRCDRPEPCRIPEFTTSSVCQGDTLFDLKLNFQLPLSTTASDSILILLGGQIVAKVPGNATVATLEDIRINGLGYILTVMHANNLECRKTMLVRSPDCTDGRVWPGDANTDRRVNHFDLLYIGAAFNASGSERGRVAADWKAYEATAWSQTFANGVNYKFADCNGDGKINDDDIAVIKENYGRGNGSLIPVPSLPNTETDPVIKLQLPTGGSFESNNTFTAPIIYGKSNQPAVDVYGIAFTLRYNRGVVKPGSVQIKFPNSWFGVDNVNLRTIYQDYPEQGKVEVAITRVDGNPVSGFGPVGEFIGIIDDIAGVKETKVDFESMVAIDKNFNFKPILTEALVIPVLSPTLPVSTSATRVFPNPTNGFVQFEGLPADVPYTLEVFNTAGQRVQIATNTNTLDLSRNVAGVYLVRLNINGVATHYRIVKQ